MGRRWPYEQAANFHRGRWRDGKTPERARYIVPHDMEYLDRFLRDGDQSAEAVSHMFARQSTGRLAKKSSAHVCADSDGVRQCVGVNDTAFAAPGFNATGLHIEQPGYASWTPAQWLGIGEAKEIQQIRKQSLANSAQAAAEFFVGMRRAGHFKPKLGLLTVGQLIDGSRGKNQLAGFADHWRCTQAANALGIKNAGHHDVGSSFPFDIWFAQIDRLVTRLDVPGVWKPAYI